MRHYKGAGVIESSARNPGDRGDLGDLGDLGRILPKQTESSLIP